MREGFLEEMLPLPSYLFQFHHWFCVSLPVPFIALRTKPKATIPVLKMLMILFPSLLHFGLYHQNIMFCLSSEPPHMLFLLPGIPSRRTPSAKCHFLQEVFSDKLLGWELP